MVGTNITNINKKIGSKRHESIFINEMSMVEAKTIKNELTWSKMAKAWLDICQVLKTIRHSNRIAISNGRKRNFKLDHFATKKNLTPHDACSHS